MRLDVWPQAKLPNHNFILEDKKIVITPFHIYDICSIIYLVRQPAPPTEYPKKNNQT